jgi:hypothetical protein
MKLRRLRMFQSPWTYVLCLGMLALGNVLLIVQAGQARQQLTLTMQAMERQDSVITQATEALNLQRVTLEAQRQTIRQLEGLCLDKGKLRWIHATSTSEEIP